MRQYIVEPMGLTHTQGSNAPQIPEPVLHTFPLDCRQGRLVNHRHH
jgi:hypothetical protein